MKTETDIQRQDFQINSMTPLLPPPTPTTTTPNSPFTLPKPQRGAVYIKDSGLDGGGVVVVVRLCLVAEVPKELLPHHLPDKTEVSFSRTILSQETTFSPRCVPHILAKPESEKVRASTLSLSPSPPPPPSLSLTLSPPPPLSRSAAYLNEIDHLALLA